MISFLGCRTDADGKGGGDGVKPSQRPDRSRHCGNWVRNTDGGSFSSPNYPQTYPPNKECLYVLEGNQNNAPDSHEITAHNLKSVTGMDIELGQFFFNQRNLSCKNFGKASSNYLLSFHNNITTKSFLKF